jgi:hypothetical protein
VFLWIRQFLAVLRYLALGLIGKPQLTDLLLILRFRILPISEALKLMSRPDMVARTEEAESAINPVGSISNTFELFCGMTEIFRFWVSTLTVKYVGFMEIQHCTWFKFWFPDPAARAVKALDRTGRVLPIYFSAFGIPSN